jgi:hypothetical protein
MRFEKIELAAETRNRWRPLGIVFTSAYEGIIAFEHRAPHSREPENCFGTSHFDSKGEVPTFFRSHYDLSEQAALEDFAQRTITRC